MHFFGVDYLGPLLLLICAELDYFVDIKLTLSMMLSILAIICVLSIYFELTIFWLSYLSDIQTY